MDEHERTLLSVHHIGGRGGDRRFPVIDAYEHEIINVLYDGDKNSINGIELGTTALASKQLVLPLCLGRIPGRGVLHILNNSGGSSLLPFDWSFYRQFLNIGSLDFLLDPPNFEVRTDLPVEITTLDACVAASQAPAPDFLSINTQGTELEIMLGGTETLRKSCIALQTEISLYQLYEGQAQLSEIVRHLNGIDFWLADLIPHSRHTPAINVPDRQIIPPIGFRRGGIFLQTDAIFFKDPRAILRHHANAPLDLAKAVYISLVQANYGMSYCYASLADIPAIPEDMRYLQFSKTFIKAAQRAVRIPVPSYLLYSESVEHRREQYFQDISQTEFRIAIAALLAWEYSETEQVCLQFGFDHAAEDLREYRRSGAERLCELLGEAPPRGPSRWARRTFYGNVLRTILRHMKVRR